MSETRARDLYAGSRLSRFFGRLALFALIVAVFLLLDGRWEHAVVAFAVFFAFSWMGYRAAGGARNPALYDGTPPVPPITDASAVVQWFVRYDPKLSHIRRYYASSIPTLQTVVLNDLTVHDSPFKLKAHIDALTSELIQLTQTRVNLAEPSPSNDLLQKQETEALLGARLRILGYFLLKKYGIEP